MKEWCMKHPILTFLIIDEIIAAIQTLVKGDDYPSTMDEVNEGVGYTVKAGMRKIEEKSEPKKEPIGFAV